MTGKVWYALEVRVEAPAREATEYGLMEAHSLGTETVEVGDGRVAVTGYFGSLVDPDDIVLILLESFEIHACPPPEQIDVYLREVADQDWLAEWKKHWQPVEVGRFIIAPPWLVSVPGAVATGSSDPSVIVDPVATARGTDTILIRINPGMAFGTGTHETTRLCLKAIEKYYAGGSFLDVGTGTGILAIAAAKLSFNSTIVGCDVDAEAVENARENARLNKVEERIDFRVGSIDEQTPSADFVCANLTAPVIVELLPALLGVTCGRLVLSGILDSQFEMVHARLVEQAATVNEIMQDNEWVALVI